MTQNQHDLIKQAFSKQASKFDQSRSVANRLHLEWMLANLSIHSEYNVLDLAAGTGIFSRAIAPFVRRLTAIDLTPAMLEQGTHGAQSDSLSNIAFVQGAGERLPFPNSTFDMAVTRFAVHHFAEPYFQVKELARVVRPGGVVAIIDLVAPDDSLLAATYNHLERLRDPSHSKALTTNALIALAKAEGLNIDHVASQQIEVNVKNWLDLSQPPTDARTTIFERLNEELKTH